MEKVEEKATTRLAKSKAGYGYKYTELAQINEYCEDSNIRYYQEIETCELNQKDYMMTYISDNGKPFDKHRGCQIVEATLSGTKNPVQEYGSSLTYCRRYSLLMALGLATEDDDAIILEQPKNKNNNYTRPVNQSKQPAKKMPNAENDEKYEETLNVRFNSKLIESGSDLDKVLENFKLSDYTAMTNEQKEKAIKIFDIKIANAKNKMPKKEIF